MDTLAPPTRRRPRVTLWLLRLVGTAQLVVLAQPVLAGLFLTGDVDAIAVHGAVAIGTGLVDLALVATALAFVLCHGRLWVLPVSAVLFVAVVLQTGFGYARELALHIPLGVTIVVAAVLIAIGVWRPSTAQPRGARR